MENILQQAPPNIQLSDIEQLYEKHQGNVAEILSELWNISDNVKAVENISVDEMKKKNKFDEIREICTAMDEEFEAFIKKQKSI